MTVTASDLRNLANDLHGMANRLHGCGGLLATLHSTASDTLSELPEYWGGPLADDVIGTATAFYEHAHGADGHVGEIADAVRTLAADVDDIAGSLELLDGQRDDPPADRDERAAHFEEIGQQETRLHEQWDRAVASFSGRASDSAGALTGISGFDFDLPPNPVRDAGYAAVILDGFRWGW